MEDIHPIKPYITTPLLDQTTLIILLILFLLVFAVFLYWFYRKFVANKKKQTHQPAQPIQPAIDYQQLALEKLNATQILIDEQQYKEFYLKVTAILKDFLSNQHQLQINELTTTEVKQSDLDQTLKHQTVQLLTDIDQAKFAHQKLEQKNAKKTYKDIEQLIINH